LLIFFIGVDGVVGGVEKIMDKKSKKSLNMVLSAIANYRDIGLKSLLIATIIAMGWL
jgi:uncharacterized protein YkvS